MTIVNEDRIRSAPRDDANRDDATRGDAPDGDAAPQGRAADGAAGSRVGSGRGVARTTSEELLARYRRKPTPTLRNELIERHRPDVESIARVMAMRLPRSVDVDDLVHAGLWGLVQAIDKFRADHGAPFRPFMRPRVRGAMLDELRNMDFLPRLYRQRAREMDAATTRLRSRLGRDPSDAELAAELGVTESRLQTSYTRLRGLMNREAVRENPGDGGDPFDRFADEEVESPLDALNRQDLLAKIEASLQPLEWMVLRMHYLDGLSGKEVAARMRLSAARICQIHLRVLSRLKTRFASLSM